MASPANSPCQVFRADWAHRKPLDSKAHSHLPAQFYRQAAATTPHTALLLSPADGGPRPARVQVCSRGGRTPVGCVWPCQTAGCAGATTACTRPTAFRLCRRCARLLAHPEAITVPSVTACLHPYVRLPGVSGLQHTSCHSWRPAQLRQHAERRDRHFVAAQPARQIHAGLPNPARLPCVFVLHPACRC